MNCGVYAVTVQYLHAHRSSDHIVNVLYFTLRATSASPNLHPLRGKGQRLMKRPIVMKELPSDIWHPLLLFSLNHENNRGRGGVWFM